MCVPFANTVNSTNTTSITTTITASKPNSTGSPPFIHMHSSNPLGISDELLCELCNLQVNGCFCHGMNRIIFHIFSLLGKKPKKKHLMTLLHKIRYTWKTIGEQLDVCYGDIKSAEYNGAYNTTKLSEVLQVWIDKRTCEVSWKKIITVVKEPPIEKKVVAEKMYKFLAKPDIRNEYLSSYQPGKVKKCTVI